MTSQQLEFLENKLRFITGMGFEFLGIQKMEPVKVLPNTDPYVFQYSSSAFFRRVVITLSVDSTIRLSVTIEQLSPHNGNSILDGFKLRDWGIVHNEPDTDFGFTTIRPGEEFEDYVDRYTRRLEKYFRGDLEAIITGKVWEKVEHDFRNWG